MEYSNQRKLMNHEGYSIHLYNAFKKMEDSNIPEEHRGIRNGRGSSQ